MTKLLAIFDVIPGWVYALVIAGLLAVGGTVIGVQAVNLAQADTQLANMVAAVEKERADRLQLVADHNLKIARMQAVHAQTQQEIVDGFIQLKLDADTRHRKELAAVRRHADVRVRDAAEAAAARDRGAAEGESAACRDLADRNATLYRLLAEGHELAVRNLELAAEGRALVGRRDAEVATLKRVIENDRAAICHATN